jgi:hypothetical protein
MPFLVILLNCFLSRLCFKNLESLTQMPMPFSYLIPLERAYRAWQIVSQSTVSFFYFAMRQFIVLILHQRLQHLRFSGILLASDTSSLDCISTTLFALPLMMWIMMLYCVNYVCHVQLALFCKLCSLAYRILLCKYTLAILE